MLWCLSSCWGSVVARGGVTGRAGDYLPMSMPPASPAVLIGSYQSWLPEGEADPGSCVRCCRIGNPRDILLISVSNRVWCPQIFLVKHSRYVVFQMAKVAVPKALFHEILDRIGRLRAGPELAGPE